MSKVYKLCDCGFMNIFEESDIAPRRCSECQRNILQKDIFSYEEYEKSLTEEKNEDKPEKSPEEKPVQKGMFKLVNKEKNIEICLPEKEDFIIGREGLGQEYFGKTVSRKHLYVTPTGSLGIRITDKESLNGTMVNGEQLAKGITKIVVPGNSITLDVNNTGITFILQRIEQAGE